MILYLVLAFGISWSCFALSRWDMLPEWLALVFSYAAKFGPSLAGLAAIYREQGTQGLRDVRDSLLDWRVPGRWYALALLLPIAAWSLAAAIFFGLEGKPPTFQIEAWWLFAALLLKHVFIGGGLGEELGWRGYLTPKLLEQTPSRLRAAVLLGLLWGIWHWPAIFFPESGGGSDLVAIVLFTIYTVVLAIIFMWAYERSGQSLLIVILFHGALNAVENSMKNLMPELDENGSATILYALAMLIFAVVLVLSGGLRPKGSHEGTKTPGDTE